MTVSEKIKIIKQIARELDFEEWGIIDLTLKQFNFPTSNNFNGNKFEYILGSLSSGDDVQIKDLGSHLNIDLGDTKSEINPVFWKDGYIKLFISHLASDKIVAQKLKESLEDYSISGFVAHSDIEPTKPWQDEIELALRTSDCLTALMIKGFHESKWTDQEIGVAIGRDLLIIPVRMGEDPYGFIGKFQAITFININSLAEEIFSSLIKNKKTNKKMAKAIMYKFENSTSFAQAKRNFSLIGKIESWDSKLLERLKAAKDNNSQIAHSFGLDDNINSLVDTITIS